LVEVESLNSAVWHSKWVLLHDFLQCIRL